MNLILSHEAPGAETVTSDARPVNQDVTSLLDVAAAAAGDVSAFERLVRANQNLVCAIAFSICGTVEESEEVAQETFLAAWQRLPKLRQPETFRAWLRQLTRNRAHDALRSRLRVKRSSDRRVTLSAAAEVSDGRLSAAERLISAEDEALVQSALQRLSDESREVLVLFHREGKSVQQVAALLDLGAAAVRKRLSRAREQVRRDVAERVGDVLTKTAPGAVFTGAVLAALTLAAPATAAVGVTLSLKTSSAAAASSAAWASIVPGLLAGLLPIHLGLRGALACATSEEERRGVKRWAAFASASVVVFLGGIVLLPGMHRSPALALGWSIADWAALNASFVYLARVTKRRRDLLRLEDPAEWSREQRRMKGGIATSASALVLICAGLALGFHWKGLL